MLLYTFGKTLVKFKSVLICLVIYGKIKCIFLIFLFISASIDYSNALPLNPLVLVAVKGNTLGMSLLNCCYLFQEIIISQVVFPNNLISKDISTPKCLPRFQVNEILIRRWISSQERIEKEQILNTHCH